MSTRRAFCAILVIILSGCKTVQNSSRYPSVDRQIFPQTDANDTGVNFPTNPGTPIIPTQPNPTIISGCIEADAFICDVEQKLFALVNALRAKGASSTSFLSFLNKSYKPQDPFVLDPKLSWVARQWSRSQGDSNSIGHDGFPEERSDVYKAKFGSYPDMMAENVAMFGPDNGDAQEIATQFYSQWRGSSGHLGNMMGGYKAIGIGVYKNRSGRYYGTQIFGE